VLLTLIDKYLYAAFTVFVNRLGNVRLRVFLISDPEIHPLGSPYLKRKSESFSCFVLHKIRFTDKKRINIPYKGIFR
jgi:hypothetical protein